MMWSIRLAWRDVVIDRGHVRRDPFEGTGAYRRRLRLQAEGFVALVLAIVACGMVAAMWIRTIAPLIDRLT
jgi:hypothetical protein